MLCSKRWPNEWISVCWLISQISSDFKTLPIKTLSTVALSQQKQPRLQLLISHNTEDNFSLTAVIIFIQSRPQVQHPSQVFARGRLCSFSPVHQENCHNRLRICLVLCFMHKKTAVFCWEKKKLHLIWQHESWLPWFSGAELANPSAYINKIINKDITDGYNI